MKISGWIFLFCLITGCRGPVSNNPVIPPGRQVDQSTGNFWSAGYSKYSGLSYLITFPKSYEMGTSRWPMVLFLHSLAERGTNIFLLLNNPAGEGNGLAQTALSASNFPFITVSPLCPDGSGWPFLNKQLDRLMQDLTSEYRIDRNRIYLTGVSMGGMGTWSLAMEYPDWFAAIAPVSGGIFFPVMREDLNAIKNIPVWVFHDVFDPEIAFRNDSEPAKRLREAGGNVRFTAHALRRA